MAAGACRRALGRETPGTAPAPRRGTRTSSRDGRSCPQRLRARRQRLAEDLSEDLLGVEVRDRDLPGGAAMPLVIAIDGVERGGGLLERREPEHALPMGEVGTRPRVLDHRGLPAREIAHRAVAHPGVLELDEDGLRAAPLSPGALNVGLIPLRGARDVARVADAPVRSEEHTSELQSLAYLVCR